MSKRTSVAAGEESHGKYMADGDLKYEESIHVKRRGQGGDAE